MRGRVESMVGMSSDSGIVGLAFRTQILPPEYGPTPDDYGWRMSTAGTRSWDIQRVQGGSGDDLVLRLHFCLALPAISGRVR